MSIIHLDTKHQVYWLSYEYFLKYNISENTLSQWSKRNVCKRKYIDGKAYINYDTIPEPTRVKLPTKEQIKAEYNRERYGYMERYFTEELQAACTNDRRPYWHRAIYYDEAYKGLDTFQIADFAKKACVIERAMEIQNEASRPGFLEALFYAYCSIYPNDYSMKNRFCMALKRAREEGVLSVAIDKRMFRKFTAKYDALYQGIAEAILRDPRCFDLVTCHEKFAKSCIGLNLSEIPSFWWLREYYRKNRNSIDVDRLGKTAYEKENGLYAKIVPALNRNTQWQLDGWEIPIYGKRPNDKGGYELWFKYVLIAVLDAHSRKYIGYKIAESENTTSILEALEMAVRNTGVLPAEIVTDNHAFNKTCEAANIKGAMDKHGVTWTVDSNPRRKAILERSFGILGAKHFKEYYGYIGHGITSRSKTARTQQELRDEYTKNSSRFLDFGQIVTITCDAIRNYNDKIKPSLKESPNARYERSEDTKSFPVDDFARMSLFCKQAEHKVTHGQITIKRGMYIYEYQLPSAYSTKYNSKMVGVKYSDFDEIYLFDLETNEPICSVCQKSDIHGAMADQTNQDVENLYKNSGRIKGNSSKERKRKNAVYNEADTMNADAIDTINKLKYPKDTVKQLAQDKHLRELIVDQGINPEVVSPLPVISMIDAQKPTKKENKSPFMSKGEVKIEKMKI
ncbi:MAG: transposase family protein [Dysgonomonas sp.]